MKHDNNINNNFHSTCGQSLLNLSTEAPSPSPGSAGHLYCVFMGDLPVTTELLHGGRCIVTSVTISVKLLTIHFKAKLSGGFVFVFKNSPMP